MVNPEPCYRGLPYFHDKFNLYPDTLEPVGSTWIDFQGLPHWTPSRDASGYFTTIASHVTHSHHVVLPMMQCPSWRAPVSGRSVLNTKGVLAVGVVVKDSGSSCNLSHLPCSNIPSTHISHLYLGYYGLYLSYGSFIKTHYVHLHYW